MISEAVSSRRRSFGVSGSSIAARVVTRRSRPARRRDRPRSLAATRTIRRSASSGRRSTSPSADHPRDEPGHRRRGHALDRRPARRSSAARRTPAPRGRTGATATRRSPDPPARADAAGAVPRNGAVAGSSSGLAALLMSGILVAATNYRPVGSHQHGHARKTSSPPSTPTMPAASPRCSPRTRRSSPRATEAGVSALMLSRYRFARD